MSDLTLLLLVTIVLPLALALAWGTLWRKLYPEPREPRKWDW